MKISFILLSFSFPMIFFSCNNPSNKPGTESKGEKKVEISVPEFNADSAYLFVKQQLDFGPRVPNTPAHEKCAKFLINKLSSYCRDVIVQKGKVKAYNGTMLNLTNIIVSFKPETNNRLLLCAHWDSRPYADHDPDFNNRMKPIDGANDGASGVGVLIEIARQLNNKDTTNRQNPQPEIGVDLILFDAEDYGPPQDKQTNVNTEDWWGLGSQYWAKNPHKENYYARFGILLDMVGAPNATFLMEGISMSYAPGIVKSVWSTAGQAGYSSYFIFEQGAYITDDHYYINKIINIPTIDIIHLDPNSQTGFYPYWHTTMDNLSAIDKNTLKAVGQTLLKVIFEER